MFPLTWKDAVGLVVPTPTLSPPSKSEDGTRLLVPSNFASRLAVFPEAAVVAFGLEETVLDELPGSVAELVWLAELSEVPACVLVSTNAEAGNPPSVSASAAFSA